MQTSLVIIDVEATCDVNMPRKKRELIEIGAVKIIDGEIVDKLQIFIKPKRNPQLSKYCKELTHISQEQIEGGVAPREALFTLTQWAKDSVIASWGEFDQEIIERELHKNNADNGELLFINLKKVYMALKRMPLTTSLEMAMRKERIRFNGTPHRAYDDAYNTYLLYNKNRKAMDDMIKKLYSYRVFRNE